MKRLSGKLITYRTFVNTIGKEKVKRKIQNTFKRRRRLTYTPTNDTRPAIKYNYVCECQ